MMNYKTMIDKDSMYNTPPCWCIYMLGLTLDWLDEQGGIEGMEQIKHGKAQMLYDCIDSSKLFTCAAEKPSMQLASKPMPSSKALSSSPGTTAKDFMLPKTSVNQKRTK